jgi:hypothetical protein
MKSTALLVAGMHRSGTSATTGALRHFGVPLGTRLQAPGGDNPKGYWENELVVTVHEQLLQELGSSWDDVRDLPPDWVHSAVAQKAKLALQKIIREEFDGQPIWAVKDPRISRLLPLWREAVKSMDVRIVMLIVARDPVEVAESIRVRNGWPEVVGELLWIRHVLEIEGSTREFARCVITYDELLDDPYAAIAQAATRLDVALPRRSEAVAATVRDFVDHRERHHQSTGRLDRSKPAIHAIVSNAFDALKEISRSNSGWEKIEDSRVAFEREWKKIGAYVDPFAYRALENARSKKIFEDDNIRLLDQIGDRTRSDEAQVDQARLAARLSGIEDEARAVAAENRRLVEAGKTADAQRQMLEAELARIGEERNVAQATALQFAARIEDVRVQLDRLRRVEAENEGLRADLENIRDESEKELLRSTEQKSQLEDQCLSIRRQVMELSETITTLQSDQAAILDSWSWRITRPVRALSRVLLARKG